MSQSTYLCRKQHLWETRIHRTAAVKIAGLPSGSRSLLLTPSFLQKVMWNIRVFISPHQQGRCVHSVSYCTWTIWAFFSDRKELFCFNWVTSAETPHHRGNQFEIPLAGRRSDKVKKKKNATVQETSHHGLRGSTRLGLLQACLDATFWWQIRCLHVAAWEDRFPWPNCFGLKLFDSLWPSSPTKLKWHIQLYLAFELGGKLLFCSARGLF